ncbi:MAG: trypsin-like peptidase domain-containing protein [Caldimonas sp.]
MDDVGAATFAVLCRRGAIASAAAWRFGLVVTAAHVFWRTPAALTLVDATGHSIAATLVGIDSSTDLALFRITGDKALPALPSTRPAPVRAGHFALGISAHTAKFHVAQIIAKLQAQRAHAVAKALRAGFVDA